uniref:RING-type domain-containing protein n=1 Tax=Chrysotila carterae TaxID=13221 RepID=A0A7S4B8F4_CHRCT|mmetsp:Transcript_26266/g.51053  ORF Transcript_26266/g.51053 Transcript_26266/m.51053 type:complete len:155 (-) Transcript_26266:77-541(-)
MGNKQGKTREPIDPQFLRPSGLYPHTEYDERVLRRLILDRKLAPCYRGVEDPAPDREECPICMLFYPGGLNRSICCKKPICTECYLQVTPRSSKNASCPYCKRANYAVDFRGPLSALEQQKLQSDEQRVIELQIESQVRQARRRSRERRCSRRS